MKYLCLLLLIWPSLSSACIIAPKENEPTIELGFEFEKTKSPLCTSCDAISISLPRHFKDQPASHAIFSVFLNNELISKSVSQFEEKKSKVEFYGTVSNAIGVTYQVQIEYGKGRCMSYQFNFKGAGNGS